VYVTSSVTLYVVPISVLLLLYIVGVSGALFWMVVLTLFVVVSVALLSCIIHSHSSFFVVLLLLTVKLVLRTPPVAFVSLRPSK